jgi:hypothetical protein|tara:strand:+ start:79 stop:675 length:597 start_codon:yes stop_codon:yes gene_type:complete
VHQLGQGYRDELADLESELLRMPLARWCRDLYSAISSGATVPLHDGTQTRMLTVTSVFPLSVLYRLAHCHSNPSPRVELTISPPAGIVAHKDCTVMSNKKSGSEGGHIAPSVTLPIPFVTDAASSMETHVMMSDLELGIPMGIFEPVEGRRGQLTRAAIFAASARTHETTATADGYVAIVSTGWEEYSHRHPSNRWGF